MAVLASGQSFSSGDQVTSTKLQDIANQATFVTGTNNTADASTIEVDSSGGYLKVPSNGIGSTQLASDASTDGNRAVQTNHLRDGSVTEAKLATSAISALIPAGSVMPYAGSSTPSNWLLCYGQAVSRTTYATLFSAIGTTYGTGDGSSTFNLPDLRGRVAAGKDNMGGSAASRLTSGSAASIDGATLGTAGGAQEHTLTAAQSGLPAHTHTVTTMYEDTAGGSQLQTWHTGTGADHTTSSASADASAAHTNTQPTIVLNYIIKT